MIPKQQIEAAKQASLPDVLKSLGIEIVLSGANFQSKNHDSLKFFRQNGVWLYKRVLKRNFSSPLGPCRRPFVAKN